MQILGEPGTRQVMTSYRSEKKGVSIPYEMKHSLIVIYLSFHLLSLCFAQRLPHFQRDFSNALQEAKPSVVAITALGNSMFPANNPGLPAQKKIGSGIIIDSRGYILTNMHVIDRSNTIRVALGGYNAITTKVHEATVIKMDMNKDLAIIKILPDEPLYVAHLGNSDMVQVGDWVTAIGSTFGFEQTVTAGIVGATNRNLNIAGRMYQGLIQTDASINQGNSGGPLINMDGQVVGINTAIYSPDRAFSGMAFAIPINQAIDLLIETFGNAGNQNPNMIRPLGTPVAFTPQIAPAPFLPSVFAAKSPPLVTTKNEYLRCPNCQIKVNQTPGIPWASAKCPGCGTIMAHVIEEKTIPTQSGQDPANTVAFQCPGGGFGIGQRAAAQQVAVPPGCGGCPSLPFCAPPAAAPAAFAPGDICPYCGEPLDANLKCPERNCPWNFQPPQQLPSQNPAKQVAAGCGGCPSAPICNPAAPVAFSPGAQNDLPPSNVILVAGKMPEGPYLGITLIPSIEGVQVTGVAGNSPAETGGIKAGDIIFKVNDRKIGTIVDYDAAMSKIKSGQRMRIVVIRNAKKRAMYIRA